jgi:hypothetical protein
MPVPPPHGPCIISYRRYILRHVLGIYALELQLTGPRLRLALDLLADVAFATATANLTRMSKVLKIRVNTALK